MKALKKLDTTENRIFGEIHGPNRTSTSTSNPLTNVHQKLGNQAFQQLVHKQGFKGATKVNRPNDEAEREAEQVSKIVSSTREWNSKTAVADLPPKLQPYNKEYRDKSNQGTLENRSKGADGGRALPHSLRSVFEPLFGTSLESVRIHRGTRFNNLAKALNARAFTYGRDIYFAPDEFRPQTTAGKRLLAHELTHVIQQNSDHVERDLLQRNDEPDMEFTLWETYEWSELVEHFEKKHRPEIEESIRIELENYADVAKEGAIAGVNEIFDPYEDDLKWKGARATQITGVLGIMGQVGSILSGLLGAGLAEELARKGIQIDELKDNMINRVQEEINHLLRYEPAYYEELFIEAGVLSRTPRQRLIRSYVMDAAQAYRRLVNEGVAPESDEMTNKLEEYARDLILVHPTTKDKYRNIIIRKYKPIVDEALRPEPVEIPPVPEYGPPSIHF